MEVSLKAWLLSLSVRERCGQDIIPVLYFYSRDCKSCVEQGMVLDKLREFSNALVYTIDINLDSDAVAVVKEAYGIGMAPSLIINDKIYRGFISYEEIMKDIQEEASG